MAENEGAAGAQDQQQPIQLRIINQFIRDMSFENVMAQKGISGEVQPDINVQVNLDARKRDSDNLYEVHPKLTITSKAKAGGEDIFLLELEYTGIFQIEAPEEQLHPLLFIECPRLLFPFLRRIVSDVTRDGGYPPLNLENIDFVALYRNELMRRQAEQQAVSGASPENA